MKKTRKIRKRPEIEIEFVPVEGDPIQAIADAFEPILIRALRKHDTYLKMPLVDFLRMHARQLPTKSNE
ncbi:hypothetical protein [Paenibacillus donghaensis]|uniref:Uncharacterized protein n=1 Tax=Paenibacillus donghaensis TaxID=414771 RepID=A0A2Z2K7Z4_9BACL|nr:hypothetical protein [Paenibacillus donghaensis]ASA21277.1 hypothetical protein B9T62_11065 [Paenibacillus donghaensis]